MILEHAGKGSAHKAKDPLSKETKVDAFVKSPPGRHSRVGGSPELLEFPGFPFSRE